MTPATSYARSSEGAPCPHLLQSQQLAWTRSGTTAQVPGSQSASSSHHSPHGQVSKYQHAGTRLFKYLDPYQTAGAYLLASHGGARATTTDETMVASCFLGRAKKKQSGRILATQVALLALSYCLAESWSSSSLLI